MKILLVDDEELQLLRITNAAKKSLPEGSEFYTYTNPILAYEENVNTKFDIAFLDIEMPQINGIQLAKKLKKANPLVNVIFVTGYDKYALDAYRIHASGYITKPVNERKIKDELAGLRYQVSLEQNHKIQVKCFGNFEIFCNGEPLKFQRSKSKELFAYLVDREGAAINVNELNAVLWEEDHKSYLRNLIADIQSTLASVDASDVFIKRYNECYVDINKIDCDAYEYKRENADAIRMYRGEYMIQYPWAIFDSDFRRQIFDD